MQYVVVPLSFRESVLGDTASGPAPGHDSEEGSSSTLADGLHRAGKCNRFGSSTPAPNHATCPSLADELVAAHGAGIGALEDDVGRSDVVDKIVVAVGTPGLGHSVHLADSCDIHTSAHGTARAHREHGHDSGQRQCSSYREGVRRRAAVAAARRCHNLARQVQQQDRVRRGQRMEAVRQTSLDLAGSIRGRG